ncbi:MAG TPA: dihydrolipoamide acetyltransferase family protein [Chitinophagaceae bacterium]|nr:dihydrolipoamide acetyltransferase family protein [Chitinophagaceae bacterium]
MSLVDLVMPKMGESIMEATILKWHKKPGDQVKLDETVLDIATDKVDTEVPSTAEGTLEEILFAENDVVPIGSVIAKIRTEGARFSNIQQQAPIAAAPAPQPKPAPVHDQPVETEDVPYQPAAINISRPQAVRFYSPLVLNIAASEGISMSDLETIPGTGNEGRVTKKDILDYVSARRSGRPATTPRSSQPQSQAMVPTQVQQAPADHGAAPVISYSGNAEIVEMDRMRRVIADHMIRSKATSAHVTSFVEADVTNMVIWREKIKKEYEKREGDKITFTPLFIEAIVKCLKKYTWLNSSVEGNNIIVKKDINIGMATALPSGNLIVPVIRNADQLNLVGLTRQVNNLANAARNSKLKPEDTQGGTFTITNVGTFGSLMGTPIINQPQVAVLATGAIKKRPVVIETEQGDSIAIRHMMYISMSYDHRIIDGALGSTFLSAVAKELEQFNVNRDF